MDEALECREKEEVSNLRETSRRLQRHVAEQGVRLHFLRLPEAWTSVNMLIDLMAPDEDSLVSRESFRQDVEEVLERLSVERKIEVNENGLYLMSEDKRELLLRW